MFCFYNILIVMHSECEGNESCVDMCNTLKGRFKKTIILRQFFSTTVYSISNNLLPSKAHQTPLWLQLKSHRWIAIKLCASMMMIMSHNSGGNTCQSDISTSKTAPRPFCNRLRVLGWKITASRISDEAAGPLCFQPTQYFEISKLHII